jgi:hypothetical protein
MSVDRGEPEAPAGDRNDANSPKRTSGFFVWFILEVAPDVRTPADALRDFQRPRLAKAV